MVRMEAWFFRGMDVSSMRSIGILLVFFLFLFFFLLLPFSSFGIRHLPFSIAYLPVAQPPSTFFLPVISRVFLVSPPCRQAEPGPR